MFALLTNVKTIQNHFFVPLLKCPHMILSKVCHVTGKVKGMSKQGQSSNYNNAHLGKVSSRNVDLMRPFPPKISPKTDVFDNL